MDKHGKTITIKINGKDRPVKEETDRVRNDSRQFYEESRGKAINETAAAQESAEENFDWILPEPAAEEPIKEYTIAAKQAKKRKSSLPISVWNKKSNRKERFYTHIFLTVFFAVLLGAGFGFTILKFVTAEPETAAPVPVTGKVSPGSDAKNPSAASDSVELAAISAFVVQNGIFTTDQAARERVALLAGQGVAAQIFPVKGQFAVYAAMAGSLDEAKQEAELLKAKGIEVFAKPVEIPGGSTAELTPEQAGFLKQAPAVYMILSNEGVAQEAVKQIEDFQATLAKIAGQNVGDENILKAMTSLEKASGLFLDYQKANNANLLTSMNAELLAFLSAYHSIGK